MSAARYRELVQRAALISGQALGGRNQVGVEVIETTDPQHEVSDTRQESRGCLRPRDMRHDGSVHRHGLRRVLDSAGRTQPAVSAQRIVGEPVAGRTAADARRIPTQHLLEKTHASAMRDVTLDPIVIEGAAG
jgi:hypothetical protein